MLQVESPPLKLRFQSEDACDPCDQVYLKSTWVVPSLRHPALRVLCCVIHLVLCFYLGVTSPLLTSLQTPARFPVYGGMAKTISTGFTWQKIIFQIVLSVSLLLFLRFVAYPRLVQRQWNWDGSFRRATQSFSRLSSASTSGTNQGRRLVEPTSRQNAMSRHTYLSGGTRDTPMVRLQVWNNGPSNGSWTFVAAAFPFLWTIVMYPVRKIVHGSVLAEVFCPEDMNEEWTNLSQLKMQKGLSTCLLVLSILKLLVTLDWILQDREFNRVLFGSWLSPVRRVYNEVLAVRVLWCWVSVIGLFIGGVYFGGISKLQNKWIQWNLKKEDNMNDLESWLSNTSWNALLSSLVVALDLLWIIQDWDFPTFVSPIGSRLFGFHMDQITFYFPFRLKLSFSSKWIGGFVVVAVLLPLEICQFLQVVDYSPHMYSQFVHLTSYRVLPLNTTYADASVVNDLDATSHLILQVGSLSRYFPWSAWDRVPAFLIVLLATASLVWLSKRERCKMCFAVFLGLSDSQNGSAQALVRLNRAVTAATKRMLNTQQRLRQLYKLRARNDSFCILLAGFSVLTVWLQFRVIWRSSAKYHRDLPLQSPGEAYAALLLLITFILLYQVHYRYCLKLEIMALRNQISPDSRNSLWRSPRLLLLPFLAEVLLCGVFLPPFVHGQVYFDEQRYSLPRTSPIEVPACPRPLTMTIGKHGCELLYSYPLEIVNMIVLVRLYWCVRIIRNQLLEQVIVDKAPTMNPAMHTGKYVATDSLWWSFRISFALRPVKVLLTVFVTLWMSTAAAVSIFERPFPSKLNGEDHALWLTLVTMTGVGYGDSYPITMGGRIVIVVGAVFGGLAFISLMTSEFLNSLKGTKREHAVLSAMDRLKWARALRVSAARLIHAAWVRYLDTEGSLPKQRSKHAKDRELLKAARQFKLCRKRKPMQSANASHFLQKSRLSTIYAREMDSWMATRQTQTAAHLDALEQHLESMATSLQTLPNGGINLC